MARVTTDLLKARGHEVQLMAHDSRDLEGTFHGKVSAFARGIYSKQARDEMASSLHAFKPDVVHVHELYPHHSPWVLVECRRAGVPVVMTCHDFRLTCPVATHLRKGRACESCANGATYWCALKNCRGNLLESLAYASRSAVANLFRLYRDNVSLFITPSEFLRDRLVYAGYPEERFTVIPNMVGDVSEAADPAEGEYIAYAGRIAPEKGVHTLLEAARRNRLPVRIAGGMNSTIKEESAPVNVTWAGHLDAIKLTAFYRGARFLVTPSLWYEAFGLVVAEAMMHGLPVLAAQGGALPELVEHGVTGLLFTPGDSKDLSRKMQALWHDPDLCRRLGHAARIKALRMYSAAPYYARLLTAYQFAVARSGVARVLGKASPTKRAGAA
ncbi:MAG: glycosyl transferase [Candidatus Hydrogenedentota bacterium]